MGQQPLEPDEPRGAPVTAGPALANPTIQFSQGDQVVTRVWHHVPHIGQMVWLGDGPTVKGIVTQVVWRDEMVVVTVE